MAVSKELLARYKEMKAKGIQISLSELKAQMEQEEKSLDTNVQTQNLTSEQPKSEQTQNNNYSSENTSVNDYTSPQENGINSYTQNQSNSFSWSDNSTQNYTQAQKEYVSSPKTYSNFSQTEPPKQENIIAQSKTNNLNNTYSSTQSYQQSTPIQNNNNTYFEHYSNYSNSFNTNYTNQKNTASVNQTTYTNSQLQNNTVSTNNVTQQVTSSSPTPIAETQTVIMPDTINAPTRKFAVIGYPLGHSLSSYMHEAGFKSLGLKASYEVLETPPETLVDRIKFFKTNNYSGFNVTIPLKLPVIMFLDEVDQSADLVNAVNTVTINPETKELKGYNTDVIGFRDAIPEDFTLFGKTAGVLGTGGAARAAITALAQSQMKEIKLYTRNIPNCLELLNYLRKTFTNVEFSAHQIERIRDLSDVNLLVNTTPIGMLGRAADMTPVEENELRTLPHGALVYDVIYNPKKTILLKLAQKYGYRTLNGVDMFIHQAVAAEKIWTGRTPDFKDMKIAVLENL